MPRKCSVCAHASKAEIDGRIIAGGESALSVARLFGLSKDSVLRHHRHIDNAIRPRKLLRARGFKNLRQP